MKNFWIFSLMMIGLSGCAGDFCDVYSPVTLSREAGISLIQQDRQAAEAIATNKTYWTRECR